MARYPETQALSEQALRHVLTEQAKLLRSSEHVELIPVVSLLNELALDTSDLLAENFNRIGSIGWLMKMAEKIENKTDDISESLWRHIPVSVSAIYQRVESSLVKKTGKEGRVADTRGHYHNLRIRLLDQLLGARMLILNSDLGDEHERIWQQFLQKQLGPSFKVLRGGHIYDHEGNRSECQIDLLVLPAEAPVIFPGDSEGGKAFVMVDQVISAIMVTSTLTVKKLKEDWRKMQSLPRPPKVELEFPNLKDQPWPLCYLVAARSDPAEELKKAWQELCQEGATRIVPQFVIPLDTGFLYSGSPRRPAPRYPGNDVNAEDVHIEDGIFGGLGLAWLLIQQQARLAFLQGRHLGSIDRNAKILNDASLREGVPATYSTRFETMFQMAPMAGCIEWGGSALFPHNRLQLRSVLRKRSDTTNIFDTELFQDGVDTKTLNMESFRTFLRWFRYGIKNEAEGLLALEEWIEPTSKSTHRRRIAVFNISSGREITGPTVDTLKEVNDLEANRALFGRIGLGP
jgi:hypothetical protein